MNDVNTTPPANYPKSTPMCDAIGVVFLVGSVVGAWALLSGWEVPTW